VLRVGERASNATLLTEREKNPIMILNNNHLAKLLILHHYQKSHHLEKSHTLAALQAGYWIVAGDWLAKEIIGKCYLCKKLKGPTERQLMGELPQERLELVTPFTNVGVDCFGHFNVKERRTELKQWGVLFTCLHSRAVHIEIIDDPMTDAFIGALRCFMALKGPVHTILCDNGTNLVGARNELNKQYRMWSDEKIKHFFADKQMNFKINYPTTSHQGAVWERQIRSVRTVLNEIFLTYSGRFDTAMLRTAFHEAMNTVNSSLLSIMNINNPQEIVITPNHFLTQNSSQVPPPPGQFTDTDAYSRARWKRVQSFAEEFGRHGSWNTCPILQKDKNGTLHNRT